MTELAQTSTPLWKRTKKNIKIGENRFGLKVRFCLQWPSLLEGEKARNQAVYIKFAMVEHVSEYINFENFRTEKLSDFFLSESFSVRNSALPKIFPSESFSFTEILFKLLKILKSVNFGVLLIQNNA